MKHTIAVLMTCLVLAVTPVCCGAGAKDAAGQAEWSGIVHEENSLRASLLYLPYIAFKTPLAIIYYGILYPTPTTQSTVPPPAHMDHR